MTSNLHWTDDLRVFFACINATYISQMHMLVEHPVVKFHVPSRSDARTRLGRSLPSNKFPKQRKMVLVSNTMYCHNSFLMRICQVIIHLQTTGVCTLRPVPLRRFQVHLSRPSNHPVKQNRLLPTDRNTTPLKKNRTSRGRDIGTFGVSLTPVPRCEPSDLDAQAGLK